MIKKFNQIIALILGTKFMMWAIPDSKKFIKDTGWKVKNNVEKSLRDLLDYQRKVLADELKR